MLHVVSALLAGDVELRPAAPVALANRSKWFSKRHIRSIPCCQRYWINALMPFRTQSLPNPHRSTPRPFSACTDVPPLHVTAVHSSVLSIV